MKIMSVDDSYNLFCQPFIGKSKTLVKKQVTSNVL